MSNVVVAQSACVPDDLARVVRAYLGWNGLRVGTSAACPSDVLVVLQTPEPEPSLVRLTERAEAAGTPVVRVVVSAGHRSVRGDLVLHSAEPGESALRSLWSATVSVQHDRDLSRLVVSPAEWADLVDGARAAAGLTRWEGPPPDAEPRWDGWTLLSQCDELADPVERSVVRCAVVTALLRSMRRKQDGIGDPSDARPLWSLIRAALGDPAAARRATASSQGFFSIPLFSVVRHGRIEELLRLHVWPGVGEPVPQPFSVHSHQPHATSWVLAGGLRNRVHRVREWPPGATESHRLYSVSWDGRRSYSLGHRQSSLRDTGVPVAVTPDHEALFRAGHSYVVPAGEFHESEQLADQLTATLFYFDATIGWLENAGVVGPVSAQRPAATAKQPVDAAPLLRAVDEALG